MPSMKIKKYREAVPVICSFPLSHTGKPLQMEIPTNIKTTENAKQAPND